MKTLLLVVFLALSVVPAFALTDYTCVSNCTSQGYLYSYCQSKCSYDSPTYPKIRQTDYKCVSDCTAKGYMYSYCTEYCSY